MTDWLAKGYRLTQPGVYHRVTAYGDRLMLCEVAFEAGAVTPLHAHPHEQISYVVSGEVEFTIGGEAVTLVAGARVSCRPMCPTASPAAVRRSCSMSLPRCARISSSASLSLEGRAPAFAIDRGGRRPAFALSGLVHSGPPDLHIVVYAEPGR